MSRNAKMWIYAATFQHHDGTADDHGIPDYADEAQWETFVSDWPCELTTTRGGETVRGRQVTASTTHVLFGEHFGVEGVTAEMRCIVENQIFGVVAVTDPSGMNREVRVELRREF